MIAVESDNILAASSILWAVSQTLGPRYVDYLNEASSSGNTALLLAAKHGNEPILRFLLEEGATVLPANRRGQAAVHVAAHRGFATCLELLLDSPVRSNFGGGGAFILAAMVPVRDDAGECRYIDAHDRAGFTALHLAAITGSSAAVAALVERGATLDSPVLRGMERLPFLCGGSTPLHIAAAQGDARTCLILLDGQWRHPGLELRRVRNMLGLTPLNCALLGGHHDVVRILLESGTRAGRGGRRGRSSAAAANGIGESSPGTGLYRMVPLHASFPDSLREHMLAVLQRAALLLQLKEIAGEWQAEGAEQAADISIISNMPLVSLNLNQIQGLQGLLRRRETSLKDFLYGLESTLRGASASGRRTRRRDRRRRAAAAEVEVAAAAAAEVEVEMAPAAITEEEDSESEDEVEVESGDRERQHERDNSLEAALHEISGVVVGGGSTSGTESESTLRDALRPREPENEQGKAISAAAAACMPCDEDCSICMDARTEISFLPCSHSLCFNCACRLLARGTDAATCPFCRQSVESVTALVGARSKLGLKSKGEAKDDGVEPSDTDARVPSV
jgi:ankyrin repeat protein